MTTSVAVAVITVVIGLVIIAIIAARRRTQSDTAPIVDSDNRAALVDDDAEAKVVERDPPIEWADSLGVQSGTLNSESRLRLINDLALIHASWVVPILRRAFVEEREQAHRHAALIALAACAHPDARSTIESAAQSSDEEEREIAAVALRSAYDRR